MGEHFENEILQCTDMDLEFNNQIFSLHLRFFPMMDSKLINMATGLGGICILFFEIYFKCGL